MCIRDRAMVAMLGMALSPVLARLMVASEPSGAVAGEKLDVMVPMVLVFVPQLLFYGIATATSAALNSRGRFVAAALAPAVNNVIVIVACLLFRMSREGAVADLNLTPFQFTLIAGGTTLGVIAYGLTPVSYTHLRAHETVLDLVCRLLLGKQKKKLHTR